MMVHVIHRKKDNKVMIAITGASLDCMSHNGEIIMIAAWLRSIKKEGKDAYKEAGKYYLEIIPEMEWLSIPQFA